MIHDPGLGRKRGCCGRCRRRRRTAIRFAGRPIRLATGPHNNIGVHGTARDCDADAQTDGESVGQRGKFLGPKGVELRLVPLLSCCSQLFG